MNQATTSTAIPTRALKLEALSNIAASFELFCLASGMEALGEMMDHDAQSIAGPTMREAICGGRIGGGERGARSASTAARLRSSGQGFAASTGRNWLCQAGRPLLRRTGSALVHGPGRSTSRRVSLPDRFVCPRETFRRRRGQVYRNRRSPAASWRYRRHA